MFDWVPKVVIDILSKKALTEATGWVKKQSEVRLYVFRICVCVCVCVQVNDEESILVVWQI